MSELKLAVDLAGWRMPLKAALAAAAELGAMAVVLDARTEVRPQEFGRTAVRQLRKILEDLNLRVAAVTFRSRRGYATTDALDRRVQATKDAFDLAYQLGAMVVLGAIGRVPPPDANSRRLLTEVLADLGQHAQRAGVLWASEAGADSPQTLAQLLADLPEGTVGIDFNPGDLLLAGHVPHESLEALGPWVLHVQATDATVQPGHAHGISTPVGQGMIDYPALLGALEEFSYRGYFTVHAAGDDPLHHSALSLRYLSTL